MRGGTPGVRRRIENALLHWPAARIAVAPGRGAGPVYTTVVRRRAHRSWRGAGSGASPSPEEGSCPSCCSMPPAAVADPPRCGSTSGGDPKPRPSRSKLEPFGTSYGVALDYLGDVIVEQANRVVDRALGTTGGGRRGRRPPPERAQAVRGESASSAFRICVSWPSGVLASVPGFRIPVIPHSRLPSRLPGP